MKIAQSLHLTWKLPLFLVLSLLCYLFQIPLIPLLSRWQIMVFHTGIIQPFISEGNALLTVTVFLVWGCYTCHSQLQWGSGAPSGVQVDQLVP